MGHLTDDMTRLVGEIKAGHAARASFLKDMGQEVASMREGFRRTNEGRTRDVTALRQGVATDLEGAHRAWFGPSPADHRAKAEAERRAREQAERERRAKEKAALRAQEQEEAERRARAEAGRRAREQAERELRAQEEAARLRAAAAKEAKGTEPKPKGPATKKGPAKKK